MSKLTLSELESFPSTKGVAKPPPEVVELRKDLNRLPDSTPGALFGKSVTDAVLARFLKGHNNDVKEAARYVVAAGVWRLEYKVESACEAYLKDMDDEGCVIKGHWPSGRTGRDHRGHVVVYNHLSGVDFPGLVDVLGMDRVIRHTVVAMETLWRDSPGGEAVLILDLGMEGLSATFSEVRNWIQCLVLWVKKLSSIMDHYPESYGKIIFTRAPKMFWATWKITKTFLAERTLQKVKVLAQGTDALSVLLEFMDEDAIPPALGGKSRTVLGVGGKVPKDALQNAAFLNDMRDHVRLQQGMTGGRESARYASIRSEVEEDNMQELLALEMLKIQITESRVQTKMQSNDRGSWRFEPGMDVLDKIPDSELLSELRQENFDPAKALIKLKAKAATMEGISVPNMDKADSGLDGKDDKCIVM